MRWPCIERAEVLAIANSDEFGHLPPSQIVPRLADQGRYLASESTFYRILREENQLSHRRSERPAQTRTKPRAISATAPNQLYSWDITYLPSLIRGQFFYLYLFVDIFYPQGTRAERSSVGRYMKKKTAPWPANCYATSVIVKEYTQNSLSSILTTAAR